MFALIKRNVIMDSSSLPRLSPPNLSPPPGLVPTLPVASTPTAMSAAMSIKQEVPELQDAFNDQGATTTSPRGTVRASDGGVKQEIMDSGANSTFVTESAVDEASDSQILKQKLEMYWKGMMEYQQQVNQQQVSDEIRERASAHQFVAEITKNTKSEHPESPGVLEKAKHVVQKLIKDDNRVASAKDLQLPWPSLAAIAANRRSRSPKNGQNKHGAGPTTHDNLNLQQASLLSQQAIATVLSLQRMQQQQQQQQTQQSTPPVGTFNIGEILPPQLGLFRGTYGPTTSSPADTRLLNTVAALSSSSPPSSTSPSHAISGSPLDLSHAESSNTDNDQMQSIITSTSPSSANTHGNCDGDSTDAPLDLSMSPSERIRVPNNPPRHARLPPSLTNMKPGRLPPPLLCVRPNQPYEAQTTMSANGSVGNDQYNGRSAQQATLEAHIKNGLAGNALSATNGPFTSLYQSQDKAGPTLQMALAMAGGKTLNELVQNGIPPLQVQQWLLAAISAQKAQQMALTQLSLSMQQQQNAAKEVEPPKKRQKTENNTMMQFPVSKHSKQVDILRQQNSVFPQGFCAHQGLMPENNFNHHRPTPLTTPTNRNHKTTTSPTLSPESQNHSGKRYRRYAKPPYSYVSLITLSILSSRDKKLRLSQILKRISEMFPFFNGSYQGWRDSVRHNLSQNECFVKVLKNPYRPTAKGNFWTVNLNSIPHELLLRQNTLVSRYAQDSGYRFRKDLSEVFDLRTGAIKVPVPRQLLREATDSLLAPLSEDPAAVMEAILLEETSEDEMKDYKDKIPPEVRHFTLEDLFNRSEDTEDDAMNQSRGRGRAKHSHHPATSQPPTLIPSSFGASMFQSKPQYFAPSTPVNNFQASLHNRAMEVQNITMGIMPQPIIPAGGMRNEQPLSGGVNPFAAAQTALLSKALATQLQGLKSFPVFQKMLYPDQFDQNQAANTNQDEPAHGKSSPALSAASQDVQNSSTEEQQQEIHVGPPSMRKNKRKGGQPVRHATIDDNMNRTQESTGASTLSPQHSSLFSVPAGSSSTPSRCFSSEAESGTTASSNPFCSPIMSSSSSKSHSSPRHDDSSEFDDSSQHPAQSIFSLEGREATAPGLSTFQALQMFGSQSLQASKMA